MDCGSGSRPNDHGNIFRLHRGPASSKNRKHCSTMAMNAESAACYGGEAAILWFQDLANRDRQLLHATGRAFMIAFCRLIRLSFLVAARLTFLASQRFSQKTDVGDQPG